MIVLIDNYDSFTYNLYHQIAAFGHEVKVLRNDQVTIHDMELLHPDAIVISPGPGVPSEAGNIIEIIQHFYHKLPILGVCLGHQAIGAAFGATIIQAKNIIHGKMSKLQHNHQGLLKDLLDDEEVMRYHSFVIEEATLSDMFTIVAKSADDGEIMAIQHIKYPLYGLQFHPESIGTKSGSKIIQSFLQNVTQVQSK